MSQSIEKERNEVAESAMLKNSLSASAEAASEKKGSQSFSKQSFWVGFISGAFAFLNFLLLVGLVAFANGWKLVRNSNLTSTDINNVTQAIVDKLKTTQIGNNQPTQRTLSAKISGYPIEGNKDAKVFLVEYSDFECPFCKRHNQDTHQKIFSEYISTNKIGYVYKDYVAVSAHNPMAKYGSLASYCVLEMGGAEKYFKFIDSVYKTTTSNGNGITREKHYSLASELGLDSAQIKNCAESGKYDKKFDDTNSESSSEGAQGTPGFIVGVLQDDGTVKGQYISGAQPYTVFKSAIDQVLTA